MLTWISLSTICRSLATGSISNSPLSSFSSGAISSSMNAPNLPTQRPIHTLASDLHPAHKPS